VRVAASRRAIRSITVAGFALLTRYGGSATIPLASRTVAPEVRLGATRFAQLKITVNVVHLSPSGAAHTTQGVAPLGLKSDCSPAFL
jgi:hypothetical protein